MKSWKDSITDGITIVSDPGLDDLLALTLLDKLTKNTPKQLVSTFGNMSAEVTAQNAQDFVSLAGRSWQYRSGPSLPQNGKVNEAWIDEKQGANGLWDVRPTMGKTPRVEAKSAGYRSIISLATLTEVATLFERGPVDNLLIMGGLFDRFEENGNPAELNIRFDVEAAKWVFENCVQTDVKLVPAEVAFDVGWSRAMVQSIPETTTTNIWLKQLLLAGYDNGRYTVSNELYDPLAVFLAFYPAYASWRRSGVRVIPRGKRRGQTVLDSSKPSCDIAVRVLDPDFVARKMFDIIFQGASYE